VLYSSRTMRIITQNADTDANQNDGTAEISNVPSSVWASQNPHQVPDFRNFTVAALENYFLTLIAIEENLAEHMEIKAKLKGVNAFTEQRHMLTTHADGSCLLLWLIRCSLASRSTMQSKTTLKAAMKWKRIRVYITSPRLFNSTNTND